MPRHLWVVLKKWWPWVSRKQFEAVDEKRRVLQHENYSLGQKLRAEKDRSETFEEFVNRFHRRQFRPMEFGRYAVSITFDPRMMIGFDRNSRSVMAQHVAHQIEAEIASGRFIETPEIQKWRETDPLAPFPAEPRP